VANLMRRALLTCLALSLLGGCAAVGPDYGGPAASNADAIASFPSSAEVSKGSVILASEPPEQWWQALQDPALDTLIGQALTANYDLQSAVANVEAARAQITQVTNRFLPSVDLNSTVRKRRDALAAQPLLPAGIEPLTFEFASVGLDMLWEIDLFGRVRRSVEAASAELGSLVAVRNNVVLAVLSTVANAYIDLRGAQLRLGVAERNVAVQQQTLDLVATLNREGAATDFDLARASAQLRNSQALIPIQRAVTRNALNRLTTLLAQPPGTLDTQLKAPGPLPKLPELVAVGQPADLLRRRPDIQVAERALAAASARIGIATADLFPTVSLIGSAGVAASPIDALTTAGAPFFSVGPALRWNIFDRRAIYARIAQADNNAAAAVARYEMTVTRALEEVDSAINAYGNERERQAQLLAAVAASRDAAQLAELRFK
jgi:outer membrane protein, multidrug efflux system